MVPLKGVTGYMRWDRAQRVTQVMLGYVQRYEVPSEYL